MNEAEGQIKARDRQIAENESERQATGDVRVSTWAIFIAIVVGVIALGIGYAILH